VTVVSRRTLTLLLSSLLALVLLLGSLVASFGTVP